MEKIYKIILFFIFLGAFPFCADAANLFFSPSSGSYSVGSVLSASVFVSSPEQAMNAADGAISFPQDKLEAVSISKSGSIFSLWVQEPSFSNSAGTVNFEGIVLNPGFIGSSGKIATISFKVKAPGVANLSFSSGSVLANDGQGTNILKSLGTAQFSLDSKGPTIPESTTPTIVYGTPSAPQISSPTHPDPNSWYAKKDAVFEWKIPDDIISSRLSVNELSRSTPTAVYSPAVTKKEVAGLSEGIHYFHAQFLNSKGWGEISHYRFQIDTTPPGNFSINFPKGGKVREPEPIVRFKAVDKLSGIDYYEVQIGEDRRRVLPEDAANGYKLPTQKLGEHTILVKAFDKAGNQTLASADFTVEAIETPLISNYTKKINEEESFKVDGLSKPDFIIEIFIKDEWGSVSSEETRTDSSGNFSLIWPKKIKTGLYTFWAQATDSQGGKSFNTDHKTFEVKRSAPYVVGWYLVNYLSLIFIFLSLLFALSFISLKMWRKFAKIKTSVSKEEREAEDTLHSSFNSLKEEILKQVGRLEEKRTGGKSLTKREESIIEDLKKNLDNFEKIVEKEIKDIKIELDK